MYPLYNAYRVDYLYKHKHWQGIPMLPEMMPNKIRNEIVTLEKQRYAGLNKSERGLIKRLNQRVDNYEYN